MQRKSTALELTGAKVEKEKQAAILERETSEFRPQAGTLPRHSLCAAILQRVQR